MCQRLYMVTTPRHFLIASALALTDIHASDAHHLVLFDQLPNQAVFFDAIQDWSSSPFTTLQFLPRTKAKGASKVKSRRASIGALLEFSQQKNITEVYVGDDRRVEFQALFSRLKKNRNMKGIYIDDGTGSYIDRREVMPWITRRERLFDRFLKKALYGSSYDHRGNIGASHHLSIAYLAFPALAHQGLASLEKRILQAELFRHPAITEFGETLVKHLESLDGREELQMHSLQSLDYVFILPHSAMMKMAYGSIEKLQKTLEDLINSNSAVGIKYHPREEGDPLSLKGKASLLPRTVPFELLLPHLASPVILGDVSTALVSAKWLAPEAEVVSLYNPNYTRAKHLITLFDKLGIKRVEKIEDVI